MGIVGQLRMERRDEHAPVAQEHRLAVQLGEHLDAGAHVPHAWRTDEHAAKRPLLAVELQVCLEARDLAAVGVPVDLEIGEAEVGAVDEDHPRARPEDGPLESPDRVVEPVQRRQLRDRRRLAARDDEPVEPVELLGKANLDDVRTRGPKRARMLAERSLQRQNTDPGTTVHVPRV